MAEQLAQIHGTEKDKVNCPFYFKIGACRHGDRCSRLHNKPEFSQTLLFSDLYQNPTQMAVQSANPDSKDPQYVEEHFEFFFEDIHKELSKYGKIEELMVCENIADHLVGNTYVRFETEEEAQDCLEAMKGRFYQGRPIKVEFSPVTDFRESRCRQFEQEGCQRGGYCNFMHLKGVSRFLRKKLFNFVGNTIRHNTDSPPRGGGRGGFGGGGRGGGGGRLTCFACGEPGHYSRDCPNSGQRGGGGYGPSRSREDYYSRERGGYGGGSRRSRPY